MDTQGGEGGGLDPCAILPAEMWVQVLDNVQHHTDPQDLIDAAATCTLFEDHLGDQVNSHRLAQVMPLLLKWMTHRDRLKCRSIAKRVTKSVDSILDNVVRVVPNQNLGLFQTRFMPPRISPNFERTHFGPFSSRSIGVFWETRAKVERFHAEMGILAANGRDVPMIGRSLWLVPFIQVMDNPDLQARMAEGKIFLEDCLQLLPTYQQTIRHVTFFGRDLIGNLIETYDIHRRILAALPNLYCFRGAPIDRDGLSRVAENVTNLEKHIQENPLPPMRYLEEISFLNPDHPLPGPLIQQLHHRYGAQLKRLMLLQSPPDGQGSGDAQVQLYFPELTHLKLGNSARDFGWRPPITLMNVQANNLVHLNLNITLGWYSMLPVVVQYVARFPILRSVSLIMGYIVLNGQDSKTILAGARYPTVKTLSVFTSLSELPLSFFTQLFPNLESFNLRELISRTGGRRSGEGVGEFEDDIELLKEDRGFECEMWESCSSLNMFRFRSGLEKDTIYFREDYKKGNAPRRQDPRGLLLI